MFRWQHQKLLKKGHGLPTHTRYAPSDRCLHPLKVGRSLGFPSHSVLLLLEVDKIDDPVKAAVAALAIIVVVDVDRNTLRNIFRWNLKSDCLLYYQVYR